MKVYTANYYDYADSKFLGVFSTPEKAIEALKRFYKENEGLECDYEVTEFEIDKRAEDPKTITLDSWNEMKTHENIFEK